MYSPAEFDSSVLRTFGDEWHLLDYGYKPFPGITFNHSAQIALLRLVEREDLSPDDVKSILVQLSEEGYETLWNEEPEDPYAAIASIEFNLAVILRERGHGLEQFSENYITAPETQEQMRKVTRIVGFEETDDFDMFGTRVTVETTDGRKFVEEEHYSPLQVSAKRLEEKFSTAQRPFSTVRTLNESTKP